MEITDKVVAKLAELSRLKFEGDESEKIKLDLERMLRFVDKLNELDTTGVSPLVYMTEEPLLLRKDEIVEELSQSQALKNAPSKDSDYFKVPKVLDKT